MKGNFFNILAKSLKNLLILINFASATENIKTYIFFIIVFVNATK